MSNRSIAALILLFLTGCAEVPQGARPLRALTPTSRIAVTAHPLATRAALDMLDRGGNAIDAAIAAQMVLGLAEPQMSGIGGGTVILYWDAAAKKLTSLDGLSSAPQRTTAGLRIDVDGRLLAREAVRHGGRSFAVPGTLPVLQMAHQRYGKLAWNELFQPAIDAAERGFALPEYLYRIIILDDINPREYPDLAMYFGADGKPLPIGNLIRNPEYARTLRRIAARGVDGMLGDGGAERIIAAAQRGALPTLMTPGDLREYRSVERTPVCGPFLAYRLCTMGPPSYGGIYLLQVLQMMQSRADGRYDFDNPRFVHLFLEAGKLARADRALYVGDPDFGAVPFQGLVSPAYLGARAASIDADHADPRPKAGKPPGAIASNAPEQEFAMGGTSQVTVADGSGNIVAMTTTINLGFGAGLMVDGFLLNDAMVNFSAAPRPGESVANAMMPGKRAFTSMAPTMVFDADGNVVAAGGSAGGGRIPDYLSQGWIEILANGKAPMQALARGHFSTAEPGRILAEKATEAAQLAPALRARGHAVDVAPLLSGAGYITRVGNAWIGGADPRRGGTAAGD